MNGMYKIISDRSGTMERMKEEGITAPPLWKHFIYVQVRVEQVYLYDEITENVSLHSPQELLRQQPMSL